MPQKSEYVPGTPCWADLATPDVDASGTFYSSLFGWETEKVDDPNAGGYTMLKLDGKFVAALGPVQNPGQPTAWTIYLATDDADKTVEVAQSAGATVLMAPMDVMDAGRMAILADPAGAAIALWQANTMHGFDVVDEANTFGWAELSTRDTAKSETFYSEVFGWTPKTSDAPGGMRYTEFKVGDSSVAGMMAMNPQVPAAVPSYWMPYFQVAGIEAAYAKATSLGAQTVVAVEAMPQLKFAILRDPQGATFGLLEMTQQ